MKILLVHNTYQQSGGEDAVFQHEGKLLEQYGNTVLHETKDNEEINGFIQKVKTALNTVYSISAKKAFSHRLKREKPDVVHIHNFFPLLHQPFFTPPKHSKSQRY
jgi:hypothetical protein